ncbi:acetyltransferase component of pyruvate dehydrogenase complex [Planctomyces bekefii]|uniref:Dihydrolipoamide acetyltransferase component of pyruvate dehydrogenase complex n=1 Tax=Planctomyces bekefii TaxID=1653850 RepID=A0A5C6M5Y4_9PLAN|nr:acetyltransferase component of pyruvate dehydrogenase complex [Planctomyces bekefii]
MPIGSKKEGDAVREGEPLVEIETDKATQEYESPEEGVLLKVIVQPGKTVRLRTPIAVIGEPGEKVDLDKLLAPKTAPAAAEGAKHTDTKGTPIASVQLPAVPASKAPLQTSGRLKASPLARKIAAEKGVDLGTIAGSGPAGRVVMRDLESMAAGAVAAPVAAVPVPAGSGDEVYPVNMMRKTIAKRLLAAKNDAPHFYLTVSADMRKINDWRARLNAEAEKSQGKLAKVSVNDLVIMAVSRALRQHPMVNASWQGDHILKFGSVHVALAVALTDGLVTPVIHHTDKLGVREIAAKSRDLATRAKEGKLSNDAYLGGTFTISNLGMFGVEEFTAIINPPQAAILAVGAAVPTPWVDDRGQVVVVPRMKMTMSCDHRVVDGAIGAQFLKTLVQYLEDPLAILS